MLAALTLLYVWKWFTAERRAGQLKIAQFSALRTLTGLVTNFFDTLGIGSFAPTTALFRLRRLVPDEQIPATLNIGHALPTAAQAFIFIATVNVGSVTLITMVVAAMTGAWFGAGLVARMRRRAIQLLMGIALLTAATLFVLVNTGLLPGGGSALQLSGGRLAVAVTANLILGALMTAGVGMYAPCLILVSLLGMDPLAAFPIMMGSCALLMPIAGMRFIDSGRYDSRAALGLTLGGIPGVLLAAFVVKSLPLIWLRWLVVFVAAYAAASMLRAASLSKLPLASKERTDPAS